MFCGTVENLKRSVDRYWNDEIQRKLSEAGVQFSMVEGVPKISVPASAAHMLDVDGAEPVTKFYDPRKDPYFASAVVAAVGDAKKRRSL